MMRPTLRSGSALAAITLAAALTGCSASANFTVDPDAFATEVANTLQQQVGADTPPNIDCGDESIDIVEGETVECELTVPDVTDIWDTTVTITEVDGTEYGFDVEVAEDPR